MGIPVFKENVDHTVYKNKDGLVVPSITTIIKIINKPELISWANWLGYKRQSVKGELEVAGYIGDITHKLIETYTTTDKVDFEIVNRRGPAERIGIKNAFSSFIQWYKEERDNLELLKTESQMAGERYGGTMDVLCNYNDSLSITDYKTSRDFYPSMFLQIAGYDLLLRETEDIKVDQYMVILLDKRKGNKAQIKICSDKDEMKQYRECFKTLVEFYHQWYYINQKLWGKELID